MKAVLLAGGLGTRISEETHLRPKPMIEIGGMPILWHIMKIYSSHGVNEFIVCCGYRGYMIKEFFANYFLHTSDITVDLANGSIDVITRSAEPWKVTLIDTGDETMTGGRLGRLRSLLIEDPEFCLTYGDGLANINIRESIEFHRNHKKLATVTGVAPPGRYGAIAAEEETVTGFVEKPSGDGGMINGGFFVLSPKVIDFIEGDHSSWEADVMPLLADAGQLMMYSHHGFWQAMDTLREKQLLERLWASGSPPWRCW
jgi:glucose-1-phosphate cytidylyltransferase